MNGLADNQKQNDDIKPGNVKKSNLVTSRSKDNGLGAGSRKLVCTLEFEWLKQPVILVKASSIAGEPAP